MNDSKKSQFIKLLLDTKRDGIENVIHELETNDFFHAPASIMYHGNYDGGLLDHSLNVYQQIMYLRKVEMKIKPDIEKYLGEESCTIISLLHDVCKCNLYKKCKRNRKNSQGKWEEYDTYEHDYSYLPVGHGEKSVIMLLKLGLDLRNDELCAIRWHMSGFDISSYNDSMKSFNSANDNYPLVCLLGAADLLASRISERTSS